MLVTACTDQADIPQRCPVTRDVIYKEKDRETNTDKKMEGKCCKPRCIYISALVCTGKPLQTPPHTSSHTPGSVPDCLSAIVGGGLHSRDISFTLPATTFRHVKCNVIFSV